jgi:hypothetical protein
MQSSITTIHSASRAIPQALSDAKQHSPEWRYMLQQIRNYFAQHRLKYIGAMELARVYQASLPIASVDPHEFAAAQKSSLLDAVRGMAAKLGFHAACKPDDVVPYQDGQFFIGERTADEIPAEGEMVRVSLPTIYDAKGVICLGEFERI